MMVKDFDFLNHLDLTHVFHTFFFFFLHFGVFLPKKSWIIMLLYLNDIEMSVYLYVHGCEVKKNVKFPLIF